MKPFSINVQITKNPKQYEAVRLGMECTLDSGETAEQAIKEATAQLNAIYAEMISPPMVGPMITDALESSIYRENPFAIRSGGNSVAM